jgi:cation transport regulator
MPFSSNAQLPRGVKNLPEHAQTIWRKAYNSALEEYGEEDRAARIAWEAVKKSYHQTKEDRWVANDSGPAGGNGNGDDDDDDDDDDNGKKEPVPQPEPEPPPIREPEPGRR